MRRSNTMGMMALLLVGGFYLWRNRFRVQEFLQSYGIRLPLSTRTVGDTFRSGVAKVSGEIEREKRAVAS